MGKGLFKEQRKRIVGRCEEKRKEEAGLGRRHDEAWLCKRKKHVVQASQKPRSWQGLLRPLPMSTTWKLSEFLYGAFLLWVPLLCKNLISCLLSVDILHL